MSHIGSKEIRVPGNVIVDITNDSISIQGTLGCLVLHYQNTDISVEYLKKKELLYIKPPANGDIRQHRMLWGTYRTLINNMVIGVSQGYTKSMELVGVGYKASVVQESLVLKLGNSYDMLYRIPKDVTVSCPKPNAVHVFGIDKQRVTQVAADIRAYRPPEPYKGKGIRYTGETIRIKEGKKK